MVEKVKVKEFHNENKELVYAVFFQSFRKEISAVYHFAACEAVAKFKKEKVFGCSFKYKTSLGVYGYWKDNLDGIWYDDGSISGQYCMIVENRKPFQ